MFYKSFEIITIKTLMAQNMSTIKLLLALCVPEISILQ